MSEKNNVFIITISISIIIIIMIVSFSTLHLAKGTYSAVSPHNPGGASTVYYCPDDLDQQAFINDNDGIGYCCPNGYHKKNNDKTDITCTNGSNDVTASKGTRGPWCGSGARLYEGKYCCITSMYFGYDANGKPVCCEGNKSECEAIYKPTTANTNAPDNVSPSSNPKTGNNSEIAIFLLELLVIICAIWYIKRTRTN